MQAEASLFETQPEEDEVPEKDAKHEEELQNLDRKDHVNLSKV